VDRFLKLASRGGCLIGKFNRDIAWDKIRCPCSEGSMNKSHQRWEGLFPRRSSGLRGSCWAMHPCGAKLNKRVVLR
jgi:hypothetical protein